MNMNSSTEILSFLIAVCAALFMLAAATKFFSSQQND